MSAKNQELPHSSTRNSCVFFKEECSREREQGSPGKAGMADEHDSNSIEPTIGIGDKHYKTILEDVRGTTRSSW